MQDSTGTPERRELSARSREIMAELRRRPRRRPPPSGLETLLWGVGATLVAFFCAAQAAGEWLRRQAIEDFLAVASVAPASAPVAAPPAPPVTAPPLPAAPTADTYAPDVAANAAAVEENTSLAELPADAPDSAARSAEPATDSKNLPVALLRIPSVELEVPVFPDTSERNLNRGAGWIAGTSRPNAGGNFAIAAHRDQHFRVLEKVSLGDVLEVQSRSDVRRYAVTRIHVVDPRDVSVLRRTKAPAVTLVTCYPFRYVGPAPRRYIVQATELNVEGQAGLSGPHGSFSVMDDHSYKRN